MNERDLITAEGLLYEKNAELKKNHMEHSKKKDNYSYQDILEKVMQLVTDNHSSELAEVLYESGAEQRLKNLINKYLISEKLVGNATGIGTLTDRIYQDMAGISYLKKYLDDPDVEEININGKNSTWIVYSDRKVLIEEHFSSPMECINIIKKMARMGGLILDGTEPHGDSYLRKGIRISGAIYPVVDESEGGIASIRKQKPSYITRKKLIEFETATDEELDFLSLCINNGISVGVAGATGSGKTADINYLLSTVSDTTRIIAIEDTKELQIEKLDASGKKINDVVQLYTRDEPYLISPAHLLKRSLRLHPELIVPAEMRGEEANNAIEAGRTGHTILSSLHANGCIEAYDRILTMYLMSNSPLSEERILKMIIEAFPIMVFKRQLKDGSRKYVEIFEATGVVSGNAVGTTLFKFIPQETIWEGDQIVKINGSHQRVGGISDKLAQKLLLEGVDRDIVERFRKGGTV